MRVEIPLTWKKMRCDHSTLCSGNCSQLSVRHQWSEASGYWGGCAEESGCACCLIWSISGGGWVKGSGGGVMYVRALTESVWRARVHRVRTKAFTVWLVSHTPHQQQCSGVRRSCWEMSQPLETPQPRLQQQQQQLQLQLHPAGQSLTQHQRSGNLFIQFHLHLWKSSASGICVPVTAAEDDSSEKQRISLCGSRCWFYSLFSFGMFIETLFNVVQDLGVRCFCFFLFATCCCEVRFDVAWESKVYIKGVTDCLC